MSHERPPVRASDPPRQDGIVRPTNERPTGAALETFRGLLSKAYGKPVSEETAREAARNLKEFVDLLSTVELDEAARNAPQRRRHASRRTRPRNRLSKRPRKEDVR
jgi:hypothetical protein